LAGAAFIAAAGSAAAGFFAVAIFKAPSRIFRSMRRFTQRLQWWGFSGHASIF
jgi:hypothetical protein